MLLDLLLYHCIMFGLMLLLTQSLAAVWRTGLLSFGHTVFFGVGAYAAAASAMSLSTRNTNSPLAHADVVYLFLLPFCGAVCAMIAGWITCAPLSRLRGDYFVAATLILSQAFVLLAANFDNLGGALGFELFISPLSFRNVYPKAWSFAILVIIASANLGLWLALRALRLSRFGLQLEAARDNPIAAASSGIYSIRIQSIVFVAASACAGFAGGIFLYYTRSIIPGDFTFVSGLPIIICVVLSGFRRTGVLFATLGLYAVQEVLALRVFDIFGRRVGVELAEMRQLFLSVLLILAVIAVPIFRRIFPGAGRFSSRVIKESR
jgi:branched-chain amino acid transport system permease protein